MPRKIRYILPDFAHHAIQRGNNKQNIFIDAADRQSFLSDLEKYSIENKVSIGAYCLMTNHVHLLLYPEAESGLIAFMKIVSQMHSQRMNRKYGRSGKFWENRYKLHIVDPDYEWVVARYIDLNPVRANMVKQAVDYEYSSASCHLLGHADKVVTKDVIGQRLREYKEFLFAKDAQATECLKKIRDTIQQEKILGNLQFIQRLDGIFKMVFAVRPRGRPREVNK